MKKIILVILGFLLFVPSIIFADMGAPTIEIYKATITNKDGAVKYEAEYNNDKETFKATNEKVAYGKTVEVTFESNGYAEINFEYYVKLSDIALVTKDYTFKDSEWQGLERSLILKDQEIRKGPAEAYESTGVTIKAGTKVNIREYQPYEGGSQWVYVEYNGTKGYLNSYDEKLTLGESNKPILFLKDTELVDVNTGNTIETIKANTRITGKIYVLNKYSQGFYIEYENKKGIIWGGFKDETIAMEDKAEEFKVVKKANVYESFNNIGTSENPKYKVVGSVDVGKVIKSTYYIQNYESIVVYYEDGNVQGWIKAALNQYADSEAENDLVGVISCKESLGSEVLFYTTPYTEEELAESTVTDPAVTQPSETETTNKLSSMQNIYIYVIGALILCIVVLVTIMLVNKKKSDY